MWISNCARPPPFRCSKRGRNEPDGHADPPGRGADREPCSHRKRIFRRGAAIVIESRGDCVGEGEFAEGSDKAEVARESEELKSTLLDAIAHEFKTPLTSIKAATTDLLSGTPDPLLPQQHELISIVDESADRLSKLVTDAIQLARIEGGTFRLNLGVHLPGSLVNAALRQMKSMMEGRR